MRSAIYAPPYGEFSDPRLHAELARAAEDAGWDGYFFWDHLVLVRGTPLAATWVTLGAIAQATERIRIGSMVTPVSRHRPWMLAKEVATLDHLSGGRVILGVGLGGPGDTDFSNFGENSNLKVLAQKLDEGLEIMHGLFGDAPFSFEGEHYKIKESVLRPVPVQQPRVPIWVGGQWPHRPAFRRAARWDGCFPMQALERFDPSPTGDLADFTRAWLPPAAYHEIRELLATERKSDAPFDLVAMGSTAADAAAAASGKIKAYREAGATWWLEWLTGEPGCAEKARTLIERGPPGAG